MDQAAGLTGGGADAIDTLGRTFWIPENPVTSSPAAGWNRFDASWWWRRAWPWALLLIAAGTLWIAHPGADGVLGWAGVSSEASSTAASSSATKRSPLADPAPDLTTAKLARTAELLGPRLTALDPIERAVALREWEAALSVPVRWGAKAEWAMLSDAQRPRLLAGNPVELNGPRRLLLLVSREGQSAGDGDLLVIGPASALRASTGGVADGWRFAASVDASPAAVSRMSRDGGGVQSATAMWPSLALGAAIGGLTTAAFVLLLRRRHAAGTVLTAFGANRQRLVGGATADHATGLDAGGLALEKSPASPVLAPRAAWPPLPWPASAPHPVDADPSDAVAAAPVRAVDAAFGVTTDASAKVGADVSACPSRDVRGDVHIDAHADRIADKAPSTVVEVSDLAVLLRHEVERLRHRHPQAREASDVTRDTATGSTGLLIDFDPWLEGPVAYQPALMRRAVRQLLRGAADRAHRHVVLSARVDADREVVVEVDDDGVSPDGLVAESGDALGRQADGAVDGANGGAMSGAMSGAVNTVLAVATNVATNVARNASMRFTTISATDGGTGFVSSVAQWHGGRTTVERSPLGGTRCVLRWPRIGADDPVIGALAAAGVRKPGATGAGLGSRAAPGRQPSSDVEVDPTGSGTPPPSGERRAFVDRRRDDRRH